MRRKILSALLATAVAVSLLAGCGKDSASESSKSTNKAEAESDGEVLSLCQSMQRQFHH